MALVISLDFELMWGVRDKKSIQSYGKNIAGVRHAIPEMLRLFRQYDVKATWATVGLLLARTKSELLDNMPAVRPKYSNASLDPYSPAYIDSLGADERSDPYHYGYSLASMIVDTPGMELGTHTFSHYYCLEEGQTEAQFLADLQASVAATEKIGPKPVSIVFPRNQFNPNYLSVCAKVGLKTFRGNEKSWMYRAAHGKESRAKRIVRLADHYANISGANAFKAELHPASRMTNVPASRMLRPYIPQLAALEEVRLHRIKSSMTAAAKKGEHFHLWWHPHNFGVDTEKNLSNLESVLRHQNKLREQYGFESKTMGEVGAE